MRKRTSRKKNEPESNVKKAFLVEEKINLNSSCDEDDEFKFIFSQSHT